MAIAVYRVPVAVRMFWRRSGSMWICRQSGSVKKVKRLAWLLFAPALNKAMRFVAKPRKELGYRTVFNLLGPIINPARLDYQLVGVYDGALTEKVAAVLKEVGVRQAMVVHSNDGMDEFQRRRRPRSVSFVRAASNPMK